MWLQSPSAHSEPVLRFSSLVGKEIDVLIDGYSEDGQLIGRTQWDAPDIDPVVFVGEPADSNVLPAQVWLPAAKQPWSSLYPSSRRGPITK